MAAAYRETRSALAAELHDRLMERCSLTGYPDRRLPRLVGHLSNARSLVTWQIAISTQNVVAQPR